jgi:trans-2,3-dihydro-3-hydroxyanthranilate isomerase
LGADSGDTVTLNLQVGQIPVQQSNTDLLWMTTKAPEFTEGPDIETVSQVLGLDTDDIDTSFPIEVVFTGVAFVLVPLKTLDAVQRTKINLDLLYPDNQIHTRMFAPLYGVPEDPATGSANSCLAGYLVKHRYFSSDTIEIQVEQGYEIARPSRLYLKAKDRDEHIDVQVGGKVQEIAKGTLL